MSGQKFDWAFVWGIVKQHRRNLVLAHIVAVMISVSTAFLPLLFPLLVDEVLLDSPGPAVAFLQSLAPESWHGATYYICAMLGATLVLRLLALVLNVVQSRLFVNISKDVAFRIREALLLRLKRVSMAELETVGSGRVNSHLVVDLSTVEAFIGTTISRIVMAVFTVLTVGVILLWLHWPLAILILMLNPVIFLISGLFSSWMKHLKTEENSAFEAFQEALKETFEAIQQIRASNREQHYFGELLRGAREVKRHSAAFGWKSTAARGVSSFVYLFGFDIFRAAAMLMVVFSDLSVGEVFAIFAYLWYTMTPVRELIGLQYSYFGASAALKRIDRLASLELEPVYEAVENPFDGRDTVAVRIVDLHFSYGRGREVLRGVSLDIEAGEKVAFVGASGGGKSTLVQAMVGLYPPSAGQIYYDGVPVEQIGLDTVRRHVATVLQRPAMLSGTIRENLEMGRDYPEQVLWEALDIAQLKSFVAETDQGLETVIGQRGVRLSGGQRQRLAIARMIVAEPKVLILDESTSEIDLATEALLYERLMERFSGKTVLLIAHRLSSLRYADRVFVFESGRISGQGSHHQLVAENELYAKLYGA